MNKEFKTLQKMSLEMAHLAGQFTFVLDKILKGEDFYRNLPDNFRADMAHRYSLHVAKAYGLSLGYAFKASEILYDR